MRKQTVSKVVSIVVATSMVTMALIGCGNVSSETGAQGQAEETIGEEPVATSDTAKGDGEHIAAPYFRKGVYVNYAVEAENPPKDQFYVFSDDNYGYTDDAVTGMGLPFDCKQDEGAVYFTFGGTGESEEKFIVTSTEDGKIYGYFDGTEDRELVFEPVTDAKPEGFNAQNYMSGGDLVYEDANGWSIRYNPERFEITQDGNKVAIVYTGECAGTTMVLVTYDAEHNGKDMRDEIAKGYGETAVKSEAVFPGTEDVKGYWAICPPAEDGSGLYMTSISRDYMDGSLTFELTGHNSGNDELDMEVSDYMSSIIDSVTFTTYGE